MKTNLIRPLVVTVLALMCAAASPAAETKELFSSAEAAGMIGQPVTGPLVTGPLKDEDSPAQATHWIYKAKESAVVVSRLDFASAAEAKKYATPAFVKKQNDDEAKVTEETGIAEKAFWSIGDGGSAMTFLKGSHVGSIAWGGRNIGSPESHKAALKAAAITIAARL